MATYPTDPTSGSSSPERLQSAASDVADSASRAAEGQASMVMTRTGDTLRELADALRRTGEQVRPDQPQIASLAETGAGRIEEAASYLRDPDVPDVIHQAQDVARRQPAIVVAASFAAGLALGRLIRSGAEPTTERRSMSGWSNPYGRRDAWMTPGMATPDASDELTYTDTVAGTGGSASSASSRSSRSSSSRTTGGSKTATAQPSSRSGNGSSRRTSSTSGS